MPEDVDTSDVDAVSSASVVVKDREVQGNTEYIAKIIRETVGGDLFRIETVQDYPTDHPSLIDQAAEEQEENLRPELKNHIENLEAQIFLAWMLCKKPYMREQKRLAGYGKMREPLTSFLRMMK